MKRRDFIKVCGLLGIGLPLQATLNSCSKEALLETSDKVIIIGAGAAGMAAAYLLIQQGVDVQILEASSNYGGRMKRTTDFADFPIPLGAEWLHVERGIFDEIVNDSSITITTETKLYDQKQDLGIYEDGTEGIKPRQIGFTIDQKFINATWFDFFEQYVVPTVQDKITYNKIVNGINYSGNQVIVQTADEEYTANKAIVSVPVKMLQNGMINFTPALPNTKQKAIDKVKVWDGCKAFIEFSEKFYPTFIGYDITPKANGQKLYYDAAYGQDTNKHILGLFAVGTGTQPYVDLSDADLIAYMLNELDGLFDGKASATYVKHLFQNWNTEPFANGAYVYDHENAGRLRTLGKSVDDKLFFAGDAYTDGSDWSSVHAAARAARRVVDELLGL